jgi:actin-related protein
MFAGYDSRIKKEIKALYKEKGLKNTKDKTINININIIDSPRRKYSVFIGAAVLANIMAEDPNGEYWISKSDYDEIGENAVYKIKSTQEN